MAGGAPSMRARTRTHPLVTARLVVKTAAATDTRVRGQAAGSPVGVSFQLASLGQVLSELFFVKVPKLDVIFKIMRYITVIVSELANHWTPSARRARSRGKCE